MKIEGMRRLRFARAGSVAALGVTLLWAGSPGAGAPQSGQDPEEGTLLKLQVKRQIQASDYEAGSLHLHLLPAKNENGGKARSVEIRRVTQGKAASPSAGTGSVSYYPADVSYQGGMVLQTTESHAVYLNCNANCFGHPTQFLKNLEKSSFIHVTDQYVGTNANQRYTVGQSGKISDYPVSGPLGPSDIVALVYASAQAFGTGYGHVHHIFFAPGIDVCEDTGLTVCYSPDNPNTFFFCAFHGSIDFKDIGHVLFSVEPFQNVPGCQVGQPSPNGPVVDSQASVLSHELIETITDPDGDAWWNSTALHLYFAEIGDECQNATIVYPTPSIGGTLYEVQPEYSNLVHACSYRNPD